MRSCQQDNFSTSSIVTSDAHSTNGRLPITKASSYSGVGPNKHSLQSRVVGFMTLLMQCNSTRLYERGEVVRRAGKRRPPNSCPLRIQPLCGEGSRGTLILLTVDPDQERPTPAPFMYETPAYNTLLSPLLTTRAGVDPDWSPVVFSNYPSFRTRFSPVSANAYKYIC